MQVYRQTKQLIRKHSGTRNNKRVLLLRDRLKLLLQEQAQQLERPPQPSLAVLRKLWDIGSNDSHLQQQPPLKQQQNERENAKLQERLTRPLGSRRLFVCGIDLRATGTDLENLFQTITDGPVFARLRRNKDGRHLGFGILEFASTLDATRALLQLNNIRIGNCNIRHGGTPGGSQQEAL
ncbi:RNA recognition motif-containing protein [Cyclospora cayetanensis]|uniref:RNA recognition motif-containing protein n=1 Tax=Cyclospora cayetanensis TaxID=88456 RepID=A0A1D3CW08_9EIME|nr:RNA recognition motif-containing protein [Cyclospora cayetanensis]